MRALKVKYSAQLPKPEALDISLSNTTKAPDWIFDISPRPSVLDELGSQGEVCAAVTAHNALLLVTIVNHDTDNSQDRRYASHDR